MVRSPGISHHSPLHAWGGGLGLGGKSPPSDRASQGKATSPSASQRQGQAPSLRFPEGALSTPHPPPPRAGRPLWRAPHQPLTPRPCPAPSHPQCPSKTFGTFSSTKDFPDDVIQFARNHPLMYNSILPVGGRPLFLQVGAGYTFTQIAADRVAAADGHYDVLFIGTGQAPLVQPPPAVPWAVPRLPGGRAGAARMIPSRTLHRPTTLRGRAGSRAWLRGTQPAPLAPQTLARC